MVERSKTSPSGISERRAGQSSQQFSELWKITTPENRGNCLVKLDRELMVGITPISHSKMNQAITYYFIALTQ